MDEIRTLYSALRSTWAPPKRLTLSEWADENFYLSAESSAEPGRWHTLPYQRGIMDAITDPEIERVSVIKSARVGYTKIIDSAIAYHMAQDPCPIMVVQPTIEDAEGFSKDEIAPLLRDCPLLQGVVSDPKAKSGDNTILKKSFPGGNLLMVGANSPRGFRRVSIRVLLFDEVDGYPASAGTEGDQIKLGIRRTEYYFKRKIVMGSTPTVKVGSRIHRAWEQSEQHRYYVPCPHCGEFQTIKFGGKDTPYGIKWPSGQPGLAYYVCEHNGCVIQHSEKRAMVEAGEWRCENPKLERTGRRYVGFHIWAGYSFSPNATWGQLASEFIESKDDPETLKTFVNTVLGEAWEEDYSRKLDSDELSKRKNGYSEFTVPVGAVFATSGVDVQDNRVAVVIRAWGTGEESWLAHTGEIYGDPSDLEADPSDPNYAENYPLAAMLDRVLTTQIIRPDGRIVPVKAIAVDSGDGDSMEYVYNFVRRRVRLGAIAIKGSSVAAKPILPEPPLPASRLMQFFMKPFDEHGV